ncbi:A/G-specific adenine glycosylase [Saccharicrinis fermentans DSM 9555 = JCM 21142]|uniref:Adenine DNA glycosylase n=2 Tax=Saccharicrinis fermentans TaxID=982 RepID=W7Y8W4_9BACT|nr:A/G-specific adenine glycosylase [Saccharicrinis fermentans DSM 9555 = JCM 21142]
MGKFSSDLILWYKENKRDLPWRRTSEVYRVWVSEIILQQTRVNQGINYYLTLTEAFPTVHHLARASEDEVLKLWQGLGYYSRARNMHAAAKYVSQELNGVFPDTFDGLLKLKGIGPYTAAAISSICYNQPHTVVDGNVFRVLTRIYGVETAINTSQGKKQIEELAQSLNDGKAYGDFNQAIMEFGALHCTPQLPACQCCIFSDTCWALQHNKVHLLPVKEKKLQVKKRYLNFIVLFNKEEQTVIQRRNHNDIWRGLYQYPLIETTQVISPQNLLNTDELRELTAQQDIHLISEYSFKHQLTHRRLIINILNIQIPSLAHLTSPQYQLIKTDQVNKYAFPKPLSRIFNETPKHRL